MNDTALVRRLTRRDGVIELRWARPKSANAFNEALVEELLAALEEAAEEQPRLLALSGEGTRFSAGFDLGGDLDDRALAWRFSRTEDLLTAVSEFPAVTIARVVGPAYGVGADLVTCCDYRLGDARARFRFPGPRFGVLLGTQQLRLRVGAFRATDILLRNEVVSAEAALRDGLLTHLLEPAEQEKLVATLAEDLGDLEQVTLRNILAVLRTRDADASMASLARSTHRDGLAARIERYRAATLGHPAAGTNPQAG